MKFLLFLILLGSFSLQAKEFECTNDIKLEIDEGEGVGKLLVSFHNFEVSVSKESPGCCPAPRCTPCKEEYVLEPTHHDWHYSLNGATLKKNWLVDNYELTGSYETPARTRNGHITRHFQATCQTVSE